MFADDTAMTVAERVGEVIKGRTLGRTQLKALTVIVQQRINDFIASIERQVEELERRSKK